MLSIAELIQHLRENPDDLLAWQSLQIQVDDPRKKQDCQEQIDRLLARGNPPLLCPQCGGGMEIYFSGELHDKRARCPYCTVEIDLPDAYTRLEIQQSSEAALTLGIQSPVTTRFTVYERRADQPGGSITSSEIEQLVAEKGLKAARQELASRGIHDLELEDFGSLRAAQRNATPGQVPEKPGKVIVLGGKEYKRAIRILQLIALWIFVCANAILCVASLVPILGELKRIFSK
jgi:hypothetical protein